MNKIIIMKKIVFCIGRFFFVITAFSEVAIKIAAPQSQLENDYPIVDFFTRRMNL